MKSSTLIVVFLSAVLILVSCSQDEIDLIGLLKAKKYDELELATKRIQVKFDEGDLSDIQLRNIYRQFYNLDEEALNNIQDWKSKFPSSYAAHLITGTYFKKRGLDARGGKYRAETPSENLEKMREDHRIAKQDLYKSLKLTSKPFLSVFHLRDISQYEGDKKTSLDLLELANRMYPGNTLARNRYMRSLMPRWGGSYEQMGNFIMKSKAEGVNAVGLMQLEAIMYDDMGFTLMERNDRNAAVEIFSKALAFDLTHKKWTRLRVRIAAHTHAG